MTKINQSDTTVIMHFSLKTSELRIFKFDEEGAAINAPLMPDAIYFFVDLSSASRI